MTTTTFLSGEAALVQDRPSADSTIDRQVTAWLRLEGLAAIGLALVLYGMGHGEWLFLVPLLLVPDLSLIGYLGGPAVGAFSYNLVHNWTIGFVVVGVGLWLGWAGLIVVGAILVGHVGMDRALGLGMKLPTSFHDTHLGRIGRVGHGIR